MEGNSAFLPQEIIVNILKRLPVKTLIRFQCVCKNWKNLLKDPLFIADQLRHSSHRPYFLVQQLYRTNNSLYLCSFDRDFQLHEAHNPPLIDYDLSSSDSFSVVRMIGSSNGLLCVELCDHYVSPHKLLVWNPAIKEVTEVPQATNFTSSASTINSPIFDGLDSYMAEVTIGFFFDEWLEFHVLCSDSAHLANYSVLTGSMVSSDPINGFGASTVVDSDTLLMTMSKICVEDDILKKHDAPHLVKPTCSCYNSAQ
ncbi:putative F-box protein At4g38870 [Neltuma alba]|uniref:putative F-box protein At4g38870 n=1 Tax=Neltuma alba TaxID=207710 RepID=UPI0010A47B52|nr:putative F-box protein At4g38870 [Prosopis alba]